MSLPSKVWCSWVFSFRRFINLSLTYRHLPTYLQHRGPSSGAFSWTVSVDASISLTRSKQNQKFSKITAIVGRVRHHSRPSCHAVSMPPALAWGSTTDLQLPYQLQSVSAQPSDLHQLIMPVVGAQGCKQLARSRYTTSHAPNGNWTRDCLIASLTPTALGH